MIWFMLLRLVDNSCHLGHYSDSFVPPSGHFLLSPTLFSFGSTSIIWLCAKIIQQLNNYENYENSTIMKIIQQLNRVSTLIPRLFYITKHKNCYYLVYLLNRFSILFSSSVIKKKVLYISYECCTDFNTYYLILYLF